MVLDTGDLLEQIFDVTVPPIMAFDGRYRRNVWRWSANVLTG